MVKIHATIWKYPLKVKVFQIIEMPAVSKVLRIEMQRGHVCMWVMVDPTTPKRKREILCFETGHEVLATWDRFIGTVLVHDDGVYHYFFA